MAGLSLAVGENDPTPTKLLQQDAGQPVFVSLTTGEWSNYSITAPTDGWRLLGPQGSTDTLSGSSSTLEDKTFTPRCPGRYLVLLLATLDGEQVRLTALYEVTSAYLSHSTLAPQERDESSSVVGWARSVQGSADLLVKLLGGRTLLAIYNDSGDAPAGAVFKLDSGYRRVAGAGISASDASANLDKVVIHAPLADATDVADSDILAFALDAIDEASHGLCVIRGIVPFDTSAMSVNDTLYLADDGTVGTTAGTNERAVGRVLSVGGPAISDTPDIGSIYFDGLAAVAAATAAGPFDFMAASATQPFTLADWQDAGSVGGGTTVTRTLIGGGRGIVMDAAHDAAGDAITGLRSQGLLRNVAAGDFCHGFRMYLFTDVEIAQTLGDTVAFGAAYVDGLNAGTASWYGVTLSYAHGGVWPPLNPVFYRESSTAGSGRWDTTSSSTLMYSTPWYYAVQFDAWLVRSGTSLTAYIARPGDPPQLFHTWTVSAGAGMVGLRFQVSAAFSNNPYYVGLLAHSGSETATPPWAG